MNYNRIIIILYGCHLLSIYSFLGKNDLSCSLPQPFEVGGLSDLLFMIGLNEVRCVGNQFLAHSKSLINRCYFYCTVFLII